jgi:transposase-like zinc ribbon protein
VAGPRAGVRYPRSLGDFGAWFPTDADCLDYLEWLRWPAGFCCPSCGHDQGWRLGDRRFECAACRGRSSTTAGTIFDRTRTPLTVWFAACWAFASDKGGVSALSLQRTLEIGSYQTAWTMLHRLRSVLVRPDREPLAGVPDVAVAQRLEPLVAVASTGHPPTDPGGPLTSPAPVKWIAPTGLITAYR